MPDLRKQALLNAQCQSPPPPPPPPPLKTQDFASNEPPPYSSTLPPSADSEVSAPLIKRSMTEDPDASALFDDDNAAFISSPPPHGLDLLTPDLALRGGPGSSPIRRPSNHSLNALRSVKSLETDDGNAASGHVTGTNTFLSVAPNPSHSQGRSVGCGQPGCGSNAVFNRRGSRSLDFTTIAAAAAAAEDDARGDTILEVPIELLSEQDRAGSLSGSAQLPPSLMLSSSAYGGHGSMQSGGSTMKRRWPSFRQKFCRFGSLRKFASQTLNSTSFDVGCGPAGSLETGLGAGGPRKCDAKVQFDDEALLREEGAGLSREDSDYGKQSTGSYLKEQFFAFFQPSDNKLAMKLFGNKNALMKEKRRQQQQGKWVIHPCSNFR